MLLDNQRKTKNPRGSRMQPNSGRGALDGRANHMGVVFTFKMHLVSMQSHDFRYISLHPCHYTVFLFTPSHFHILYSTPLTREIRKYLEVNRDKIHHIAQTCRLIQRLFSKRNW